MPKSRRDRTTGLPIPSPVVPATSICIKILVPNALEYRSALKGVLSELGKSWTWSQTEGEDNEDAFTAAELWRERIENAVYQLDCGDNVNCDDVADCIETSPAVQEAIAQQIANNAANQTTVYNTSVYGAPMPLADRTAPLATPPACDYDVLFAMATAIMDQIHTNNLDFLQVMEASSNITERARNVISAIPGLGLLPVDEVIEVIDQLAEEIEENYEAQYTTAVRDALRCALFCAAKDAEDCIITFDMVTSIFEDRLGYFLDPVNTAAAVLQYFVNSTWAGTSVVDIMSLIQVAFWREASNFLGINIRTLQLVARLVIDNPDPDWEILCEDCIEPPVEDCEDLTADDYGWYPSNAAGNPAPADWGDYIAGQGFAPHAYGTIYQFFITRTEQPDTLTNSIKVTFNEAVTNVRIGYIGGTNMTYTGLTTNEITFDETSHPGFWPWNLGIKTYVTFASNLAPTASLRFQEVCFEIVLDE